MPIVDALVWRRADFRESSRLVTFVSRERGRFVALAKGAHRPGSATLGKLDFLNRCRATISGRGMPLLSRIALVHEPRALREPCRYLAAAHLVEILDVAFVPDRPDEELFELTLGAITLVEKIDPTRLPLVIAGIELRYLRALGQLGQLDACGQCGRAPTPREPLRTAAGAGGLWCRDHAARDSRAVDGAVLRWLGALDATLARHWPSLPDAPRQQGGGLALLGNWLECALEFRPRLRSLALRPRRPSAAASDAVE